MFLPAAYPQDSLLYQVGLKGIRFIALEQCFLTFFTLLPPKERL